MKTKEKVLIGLSGGINSMAVLCWLSEQKEKPDEVHLFYAHFAEHSPDTFQFVADGIRFARKHFKKVVVKITRNSALEFFEKNKMIPHPAASPCTRILKIEPMAQYAATNSISIDLVGYVKHELKRRAGNQLKHVTEGLEKRYVIGQFTDQWCFEIVDKYIGWHPPIYDLKWNDIGFVAWLNDILPTLPEQVADDIRRHVGKDKRVFDHNNCLPCKNIRSWQMICVQYFYSDYYKKAMDTASRIKKYWGRDSAEFYSVFGRDLAHESTCETCKF